MLLDDIMQQGTSVTDSLSSLCTMLVVMDPAESGIPVDGLLRVMKDALREGIDNSDGDVVVLCLRATGILLERSLRHVKRHHAVALPFLVELFHAALPAAGDAAARSSSSSSSQSTAPKRRRSTSTSTVPSQALVFSSSRPHELGEEALRCLPIVQQVPAFASSMPSVERQAQLCLDLSRSAAPIPVIETSLAYLSSVVRADKNSHTAQSIVSDAGVRCIEVVNNLATNCDFSPQWDSLLCAATQLALVVKARLETTERKRLYADAYLRLCAQSMLKSPVPQRLALIVGCASSVITDAGLTIDDVSLQWDLWIKQALDLGASNVTAGASLKIGNPFVGNGNQEHDDIDNFNSDDDDDDDDDVEDGDDADGMGRALPNRSWVTEDAKVSILFLVAHGLFGCSPDKMRWKYTAAWRDDDETFRRYPPSVGRSAVAAYLQSADDTLPLPHISSHHGLLLNTLLQVNSHTSMLRPVFLQPIPSPGCTPKSELQFPSTTSSDATIPTTTFDLESWLRILQPYCAASSSAASSGRVGGAKVTRACSILANGIVFFLFTAIGKFDPALAEKILWSLQSFFSSDLVDESRKVNLVHTLVSRDARWGDVLGRSGAYDVLKAASQSSPHHEPSGKKHRTEAHHHRPNGTAAMARSLLSQLGSNDDAAAATFSPLERIDDLSQCSDEFLSTLLCQEGDAAEIEHSRSSFDDEETPVVSQLSLIIKAVVTGVVPVTTFRKAMLRAVERSLISSSSASNTSASYSRKLTKEQCDRSLAINICIPNAYAALQCPQKHLLRVHHSNKWTCNKCARHFPAGSLACRECDYDLCSQCVSELQPNRLEVSHCLTITDVLRYIRSVSAGVDAEQPAADQHAVDMQRLLKFAEEMKRALLFRLNDASRALFQGAHTPTLSTDPAGTLPIHASLTVQQAYRRCFAARKFVPQAATTATSRNSVMVHLHNIDSVSSLPLPCTCSHTVNTASSPYSTPRILPLGRSSPRHSPQQAANSAALPATVPRGNALEALVKACTAVNDWGATEDSSASFSLNQLVVAMVRNHASDVFFLGADGLPKELQLILGGSCRALVNLSVRTEVMRFCGAECRRAGLLHMFTSNLSVRRGHVPLTLNEAPVPTKVLVSRSEGINVMMTAIDEAFLAYPTIRSKVEFSFAGEEGTGDGPTQELYTEVSVGCTSDPSMWWCRAEDNAKILFPASVVDARVGSKFRALGACFARAFVDNFTMSLSLEPTFWKLVVAVISDSSTRPAAVDGVITATTAALNEIAMELEPILHKSLASMKTLNDDEIAALDMTFEDEITIVSSDNIHAYVEEVIAEKFKGPVALATSFVSGFGSVLDPHLLFFIDPTEADTAFCGGEQNMAAQLTEELLRRHVVGAHGYTSDSSELQWLVRVVATMDKKDQSLFVEFLTGSPRLPVGGLAGLNRSITVAKKEFDCGQQTLPSCNTCFLYLKVPPYKTESQLKERLLLAIREGRRNFSLS